MIPEQLDLFGGPPKPPQKIRVDDTPPPVVETTPDPIPVEDADLPDWVEDTVVAIEQSEETFALAEEPITEDILEDDLAIDEPQFELTEQPEEEALQNDEAADEPLHDLAEAVATVAAPDPLSEVIAWMEPGDNEPAPVVPEPLIVPTASEVIELPANKKSVPSGEAAASENGTPSKVAASIASEEGGMQQFNIPPDEILFQRQYYSMRETATMFDITHSMLRYWENEFDILQPRKNRKGDRYFRPIDIKNLQLIYHLLKVRKFTLDGAREYLRNHSKALDTFELVQKLEKVKSFLHELKAHL
ncbi:MAG TPA: MerR family transcriptional regulator [Phnomibacter sp.]|nr:MerR family transcriptional regulator [Phnomibacter sp.]